MCVLKTANDLHEFAETRMRSYMRRSCAALAASLRHEQLLGVVGDRHQAPQLGKHAVRGSLVKNKEFDIEMERFDLHGVHK